jgi:L-amino acid N-acyltransferase YncA
MFAYAGTYSVEADRVIHNLDMSWNKAWEGTQQVRFITTDGSTLTYRSAPAKNPLNGKDCVHTVKFQKVGDDGRHSMASGYAISLATPDDIPGILSLQEPNLPDSGGSLSVRLTEDWFKQAVAAKSVVVGRSNDRVVGYVLGTSLAAKAHVAIIQAMLRAFPPPSNCYLYGPVCVAETERGKGLASALFKELQTHMDGRPAMTFIKADNEQSLRAHDKMGMKRLGMFTNGAVTYVALKFTP